MNNFFDEDFSTVKEEVYTNAPKTLTPGTYKLLISSVEVGKHVKGQDFIASNDATFMGDDIEFRFHCCTTDKVGDFPAGWKHTFFFQTKLKNPDGIREARSKIALRDMQRITEACGFSDWPKDPQEWQGKMFVATFAYGYAKNDTAKEKPFLNLVEAAPATALATVAPQPSSVGSNTEQPDWN